MSTIVSLRTFKFIFVISLLFFSIRGFALAEYFDADHSEISRIVGYGTICLYYYTGIVGFSIQPFVNFTLEATSPIVITEKEDSFAKNLWVPDSVIAHEPLSWSSLSSPEPYDPLQEVLEKTPVSNSPNYVLTPKLGAMERMATENPELLKRYLISMPYWHVEETRVWSASRIFSVVRIGRKKGNDPFPPRLYSNIWVNIGFSTEGADVTERLGRLTVKNGESVEFKLTPTRNLDRYRGSIDIVAGPVSVVIGESSSDSEPGLIRAVLRSLERESTLLAEQSSWDGVREVLPENVLRRGTSEFNLKEGMQGGIYIGDIWVNQGEPGYIYLTAYEVIYGTELSAGRLKGRSSKRAGWSDDPEELFLYNPEFTIYEGNWGEYYAARFEAWFVPDSGEDERKILEKVFKIEGWQR